MCADNGWTVVGEYHDEGFSAYSGNRGPGLTAARRHAAEAAAEDGTVCMLVWQHSDRLSRGAGDKPKAAEPLIEIWHAERRRDVHLRSVEDDPDLRDSASVANIGARNNADSAARARRPGRASPDAGTSAANRSARSSMATTPCRGWRTAKWSSTSGAASRPNASSTLSASRSSCACWTASKEAPPRAKSLVP